MKIMSTPSERGRAAARKRSGGVGIPLTCGRLMRVSHIVACRCPDSGIGAVLCRYCQPHQTRERATMTGDPLALPTEYTRDCFPNYITR